MSNFDLTMETLQDALTKLWPDNGELIKQEAEHVFDLLSWEGAANILKGYKYIELIAAGGSGIVFLIEDKVTSVKRALKVSRSTAIPNTPGKDTPVQVDKEIYALSMLNHNNITRLYNSLQRVDGHYLFITEYVDKAETIDAYINRYTRDLLSKSKLSHKKRIELVCTELANKLLSYSLALSYMHEANNIFHMDIKPGNLLVSGSTKQAFVTDLGFARCKKHYKPGDDVMIGFTIGYAHPDLTDSQNVSDKFLISETHARAKIKIKAEQLSARFDLYSFGRTILALLKIIEDSLGNHVRKHYSFMYLHFLSTLLLDGRNHRQYDVANKDFLEEHALGMNNIIDRSLLMTSFASVSNRFERLLDKYSIYSDIPELKEIPHSTINHGTGQLPKTDRILEIINHPAVLRLKNIKHLGIIREIYPGATHDRYAHTLGVTDYAIRYIKSIYNDPHNPIFKVIIDPKDIYKLILYSLLHDIGHTEFGHEFEELDSKSFDHKNVLINILKTDWKNNNDETLKDIIESDNPDGWNIKLNEFLEFINMDKDHVMHVLHEIIDGKLDADKIDYLQRDARNCNVPYARGMDKKRFFSCITCVPVMHQEDRMTLHLGVKEKGKASCHKVFDIRHDMYESVYLQHTARALKSMILTCCFNGLRQLHNELPKTNKTLFPDPNKNPHDFILNLYTWHISGGLLDVYMNDKQSNAQRSFVDKIQKRIKKRSSEPQNRYIDDAITLLLDYFDDKHHTLYQDFLSRNVYKRLIEVPVSELGEHSYKKMTDAFQWSSRIEIIENIENELYKHITHCIQNQSKGRESLSYDEPLTRLDEIKSKYIGILFDVPLRLLVSSGGDPFVIRDSARKSGNLAVRDIGDKHNAWTRRMDERMKEITVFRVFAHPDLYEIAMRFTNQISINKIIRKYLDIPTNL